MKLVARENNITSAGADKIAAIFYGQKCKLTDLDISSCNITSLGFLALFEALRHNHRVRNLNLSGNPCGFNQHFDQVRNMASSNNKLQSLNLSNCKLDSSFLTALSKGLLHNQSVKAINLSQNIFDDDGLFQLLYAILSQPDGIQDLNLSGN